MSTTTVQTAPQLPTADQLSAAWTKLADVQELVPDPIMPKVFQALNYDGEQSITFEQIGRLGAWAREIERMTKSLSALAHEHARGGPVRSSPDRERHRRAKSPRVKVQRVRNTDLSLC